MRPHFVKKHMQSCIQTQIFVHQWRNIRCRFVNATVFNMVDLHHHLDSFLYCELDSVFDFVEIYFAYYGT